MGCLNLRIKISGKNRQYARCNKYIYIFLGIAFPFIYLEWLAMNTFMILIDTATILFFYEDDNFSPWTNEMISRTNRFLKVDTYKIPVIFEADFSFVICDSAMNVKAISKTSNWMNFAELKLLQNKSLVSFKNHYVAVGRKVSEEEKKESE